MNNSRRLSLLLPRLICVLGLLGALIVLSRVAVRTHLCSLDIVRYESRCLALIALNGRLRGFQVDAPRPAKAASQPHGARIRRNEVVPGTGALGIHFGDADSAVSARFGRPTSRFGFRVPGMSGALLYDLPGGFVSVIVDGGRVSQLLATGIPFESPLGFEYGMRLSDVIERLGPPDTREARVFYRVGGDSPGVMAVLAVIVGLFGVLTYQVLSVLFVAHNLALLRYLTASLLLSVTVCLTKLPPLWTAGGFLLPSFVPAASAVSWLLPWAGAAGVVRFRQATMDFRSGSLGAVLSVTIAAGVAVVTSLGLRLTTYVTIGGVPFYTPQPSPTQFDVWSAVMLLAASTGLALEFFRGTQTEGN